MKVLILSVFALFFVACSEAAVAATVNAVQPIPIGTIEGKTFYTDNTRRSWSSSWNYCISVGLRLASIDSLAQRDFLISKANYPGFISFHWTSGRDAHEARQMTWHNNYQQVNAQVAIPLLADGIDYQTCLEFCPDCSRTFHLYPCSATAKALCEG